MSTTTTIDNWNFNTVLVTGGTGFIGSNVVQILLTKGIKVVMPCRNSQKAQRFVESRPEYKHLIKTIIVDDFEEDNNKNPFIEAVKGCDGIIHIASPFLAKVTDVENQLIKPAIHGVQMIMDAAYSNQETIKRIVLTSSFASVLDLDIKRDDSFVYTAKDWNPVTYEEACKADEVVGYRGSKKYAELTAWNFIKEKKPKFDLSTICIPLVFGPVIHPVTSTDKLNVSNSVMWNVVNGQHPLPVARVPVWIDVRDLALGHVNALLKKTAGGQRFVFSSPTKFSYGTMAKLIKEKNLSDKVTDDYSNQDMNPKGYSLDWKTAEKELDLKFHSFEDCVTDSVKSFNAIANGTYKY